MGKRDQKKLKLRRETLKQLSAAAARGVAGGTRIVTEHCLITADCATNLCNTNNCPSYYVNTSPQACYTK